MISNTGRSLPGNQLVLNVILLVFALLIATLIAALPSAQSLLEIEIEASGPGALQVFFDQGEGFSERLSSTRTYATGTQVLSFTIPAGGSKLLRIDPMPHTPQLVLVRAYVLSSADHGAGPLSLANLHASHEISALEHLDAGAVRLSMPVGATDPQTLLPLERTISTSTQAVLWNSVLWQLLLVTVLVLATRTMVTIRLPATHLYMIALALIIVMAMLSSLDPSPHPDEFLHILDANHFQGHWLPPSLSNGELAASYTNNVYGVSYLYEWNVVYWFAGKFGTLLSSAGLDPRTAYRLFNVLLMGLVGAALLYARAPRSALTIAFVTPQLWYVFSYFNGDAFPFAMGCIIVALATVRDGALQRFITGGPLRWQVVIFAFALGLLLISKKNYLPVALFSGLWLCATCLRLNTLTAVGMIGIIAVGVFTAAAGATLQAQLGVWWITIATVIVISGSALIIRWFYMTFIRSSEHRETMARLLAVHIIAVLIAAPWIVVDVQQNGIGEGKSEIVTDLREHNAAYAFKPSTIATAPEQSYPGLQLAGKGVTLEQMLVAPYDWLRTTFRSFFSAYGYMEYFGPSWMYSAFGVFFIGLVGIGILSGLHGGEFGIRHVVLSIGSVAILIGAAALHSLTYDFQPQGRYVLGILPMLMPLLAGARFPGPMRVLFSILAISAFALSAYSFIMIGLLNLI